MQACVLRYPKTHVALVPDSAASSRYQVVAVQNSGMHKMAITATQDFAVDRPASEKGFFARLGEKIMESRKRQADRAVAGYLLSLDDETLTKLGYNRDEVLQRDPRGYPFI